MNNTNDRVSILWVGEGEGLKIETHPHPPTLRMLILTCVSDCATDGRYSTAPVDILTDCTSYIVHHYA
jgi:hypothetical protein